MEFKHSTYLNKIENCPNKGCVQKELPAFRWVHDSVTDEDFIPISIQKTPPQRILDSSDKHCMSYGLSFFESVEQARTTYMNGYSKRTKPRLQEEYIKEKGNKIALINITKSDGVCSDSSSTGHFTFYEYISVNFVNRIQNIFNMFEYGGNENN